MTRCLAPIRRYIHDRQLRHIEPSYGGLRVAQWWAYRGEVIWFFILGTIFLVSPRVWFGPTWSHYNFLPHGGAGIGVTCLALGASLTAAIWLRSKWLISAVLLLGAIAFWIGAFLIAAQALSGHTGLMETPMMMYISVDLLIRSAVAKR